MESFMNSTAQSQLNRRQIEQSVTIRNDDRAGLILPIDVTTMPNLRDIDGLIQIIYRVDFAIISNTNSPKVTFASQLSTARRARISS
jgi:hypothetical protein